MTTRRMIKSAGKATYVSPNRGLALLDEAIEQIELQTKRANNEWEQGSWRCGSGMCLAGWIAQLAGGQWAFPASDVEASEFLIATDADDPDEIENWAGVKVIAVSDRAAALIGADTYEAGSLFSAGNSLAFIREIRDEFAESVSA